MTTPAAEAPNMSDTTVDPATHGGDGEPDGPDDVPTAPADPADPPVDPDEPVNPA